MARSAKFCLLSAWKWCHLWPPCMHFVATKCVRLCTCIIGIKFCEQQQPMLRLMFNLNTAMMPAGLCTQWGWNCFCRSIPSFLFTPTFIVANSCYVRYYILLWIKNLVKMQYSKWIVKKEHWFEFENQQGALSEEILNLLVRAFLLAVQAELCWWTKNWKFWSEKKVHTSNFFD